MHSADKQFLRTESFRQLVCSYLPGATLFHKIALLNSQVRENLPQAALLNQIIVITVKKEKADIGEAMFPANSLFYAYRLADCFQILLDKKSSLYFDKLSSTLELW